MGHSQPRRIEERVAHECWVALLLLAVALAQSALLPRPLGFILNPMLILVVCHSLVNGPANAARWAFYGGLSLDVCSDSALGTHALALLVAALVAALALGRLSRGSWLLPLVGIVLGAVAYNLLLALIWELLVAPIDPRMYLLIVLLPSVLTALIPALPLFLVMRWFQRRQRGEVMIDVY